MVRNGLKSLGSGILFAALAAGILSASGAQAALTYSGDVSPADPSTWTSSTTTYVGNNANGALTLDGGSALSSSICYLGNNAGMAGIVTLDGTGTNWNVSNQVRVGEYGSGILSVTGGASLTADRNSFGLRAGSSGTVVIDGPGSTITSKSNLTIGSFGSVVVKITNGGALIQLGSGYVNMAMAAGSSASLFVDGPGSQVIGRTIAVGYGSAGVLSITNGANVNSSTDVSLALQPGTTGNVTVNGSGSTLSAATSLTIGSTGTGARIAKLSISDSGAVTASSASINAVSTLTTDVGRGSLLTVGSGAGTITNAGTIRLVAGASAANGTYAPISAGTWTGTGTVQALGGIWDATNHTVAVSSSVGGAAGSALTADLATTQRFLFTDGSTGKSVGTAFQATASPTNLTLASSATSGTELASLQSLLGTGQAVLSAWDFNATEGYTEGNPLYLSLFAGSGQSLSNLNIWHYDGSAWNKYDPSDLAYDNAYASFTATGLSSYAVSGAAPVPIPAAAWLLGSGLLGLVGARRRFFKL